SRSGVRLKPTWIVVAVLSTLLPWAATFFVLSQVQKQEDRHRVLQALRDGDRKLALAERRRADPSSAGPEVDLAAREALVEFSLALRWAAGNEPEARLGIGRAHELLGDDRKAEEAYLEAGGLPAATSALA